MVIIKYNIYVAIKINFMSFDCESKKSEHITVLGMPHFVHVVHIILISLTHWYSKITL